MGGSGSGGGGGSSGTIDYPEYMKAKHEQLINTMENYKNTAINQNPFVGMQAWNPQRMIKNMECTIDYYDETIHDFDPETLWRSIIDKIPEVIEGIVDSEPLDEFIDSQQQRLRINVEQEILPKFRRGMQNIGAVNTSAFKIGEALIWAKELEEEAALEKEYKGKLMLANYEMVFKSANDIISLTLQKIGYVKDVMHYNLEALRMGYSAMKEYQDGNNIYAIEKVKWPLEMHKYMMDALGSIASSAGTSYSTSSAGGSRAASSIGGALSGAATGAAVTGGNPVGAAIGGAVGMIAGLF